MFAIVDRETVTSPETPNPPPTVLLSGVTDSLPVMVESVITPPSTKRPPAAAVAMRSFVPPAVLPDTSVPPMVSVLTHSPPPKASPSARLSGDRGVGDLGALCMDTATSRSITEQVEDLVLGDSAVRHADGLGVDAPTGGDDVRGGVVLDAVGGDGGVVESDGALERMAPPWGVSPLEARTSPPVRVRSSVMRTPVWASKMRSRPLASMVAPLPWMPTQELAVRSRSPVALVSSFGPARPRV
ncbi:MAG: hypothetical protein U5R31_09900 [Acidimicrobiia bacterium]|nr:hypothetical protein [Acidimicrobiia bacterium]